MTLTLWPLTQLDVLFVRVDQRARVLDHLSQQTHTLLCWILGGRPCQLHYNGQIIRSRFRTSTFAVGEEITNISSAVFCLLLLSVPNFIHSSVCSNTVLLGLLLDNTGIFSMVFLWSICAKDTIIWRETFGMASSIGSHALLQGLFSHKTGQNSWPWSQ